MRITNELQLRIQLPSKPIRQFCWGKIELMPTDDARRSPPVANIPIRQRLLRHCEECEFSKLENALISLQIFYLQISILLRFNSAARIAAI